MLGDQGVILTWSGGNQRNENYSISLHNTMQIYKY